MALEVNRQVRDFLDSAVRAVNGRNYRMAADKLQAALTLDRDNPEVLYNLGIVHARLGEYDKAMNCLERLLHLPFTFIDIISVNKLFAYMLVIAGSIDKAIQYLSHVLNLVPDDVAILNMLGFCLDRRGKTAEAIEVYKKCIEIDQHNYTAYNALAYILARHGQRLSEALKYAKIAYESNPENPAYLDTIGYVYLKKGADDIAKNYLKKALAGMPESTEIKDHINELLKLDRE